MCVPNLSRGQAEQKMKNQVEDPASKVIETHETNESFQR